ncbi:MAG: KAP family NTPase [Pelagimonas sp.]|nr:KAP family NTPase [Pelagimonas sp.]
MNDLDVWHDDRLGFKEIGHTFGNLVRSFDRSRVISIEAGFGRGKSFFRERWAKQLRAEGEVVIEIDAQRSDHSGDPVVTFLGALMDALPAQESDKILKAWATGQKIAWAGAKILASVAARGAGEEAVGALQKRLSSDGETSALDELLVEFSKGASKALSAQVSAQMSAERVRLKEMPEQLEELRLALADGKNTSRVIVLIDELDRCHPEYALALLEAMKLVFNQDGFVFVLMVNADHLERLAGHRFGSVGEGERYIDKFVDLRLQLPFSDEALSNATADLAMALPLANPLGDDPEFNVERAAKLAAVIAPKSGLSMRQIEGVLVKVDLVLRCYKDEPIDCALLVGLAFKDATPSNGTSGLPFNLSKLLPRVQLEPIRAANLEFTDAEHMNPNLRREKVRALNYEVRDNFSEFLTLTNERLGVPHDSRYEDCVKVFKYLAPDYIPRHQRMLDAIQALQVSTDIS